MKRFLTYTCILLSALVLGAVVADAVYTYSYHNGAHRSKIMWLRDFDHAPELDFLVLGSSRTNYSIKPNIIADRTGQQGYNLGMNSCSIVEIRLLLAEFLKRGTVNTVFVQVDDQYKQDYPDPIGEVAWMPFIREDAIYEHFNAFEGPYATYKWVPFYRYQKFGARLGFREVASAMLGTGYDYANTKGYMPRYGMLNEEKPFIPDVPIETENELYEELIAFCKTNSIEIHFFTAPYYKFKGDIGKLETFLPNYTNFSDSIPIRKLFSDQTHLNDDGAKKFTEIFIETYFSESQ